MAKVTAEGWTRALTTLLDGARHDTALYKRLPKVLCTKKAFRSWVDLTAYPDELHDDIGYASLRSLFLYGELRPEVFFETEKNGYSVDGVISYVGVDDDVYEHAPCVKI